MMDTLTVITIRLKNIGIRKFKFLARTQFYLSLTMNLEKSRRFRVI